MASLTPLSQAATQITFNPDKQKTPSLLPETKTAETGSLIGDLLGKTSTKTAVSPAV